MSVLNWQSKVVNKNFKKKTSFIVVVVSGTGGTVCYVWLCVIVCIICISGTGNKNTLNKYIK